MLNTTGVPPLAFPVDPEGRQRKAAECGLSEGTTAMPSDASLSRILQQWLWAEHSSPRKRGLRKQGDKWIGPYHCGSLPGSFQELVSKAESELVCAGDAECPVHVGMCGRSRESIASV